MSDFIRQYGSVCAFEQSSSWVILSPIEQSIKAKIEKVGIPLKNWDVSINYGIKTGCNEAFIIDETKRVEILANCADAEERARTDEIIRPILRGRDIKRYGYNWAELYLIATHNGIPEKAVPKIDIEKYPAVKAHLDSYWKQIEARADQGDTPYHLRSCAYMDDFSKPKIVWGELSDKSKFSLDLRGEFFSVNTCFLMTGEKLAFLTCYLNSSFAEYLFSKVGSTSGMGTVRWLKFTIEQLMVPRITLAQECEFIKLLDEVESGSITESDINYRIYALCKLSPEEISFVESYSASI